MAKIGFLDQKPKFWAQKKSITGQNGVHLVREISPWSSQVLCIGLAQNLKPILSDDKYWNPNISAFGMWLICDNTMCMPWNISKYDLIQFQIQYMDLPLSNSRTYAFPHIIVNQFQIPIHRVTIHSLFTYIEWHLLELKWPNPISNPIHGYWLYHFGHF